MATMYQRIQELAKKGRPAPTVGTFDDKGRATQGRTDVRPKALEGQGDPQRGQLGGPGFSVNPPPQAGTTPVVNQAYQMTDEQKAAAQLQQESIAAEKKRPRGRAATLLTGSAGLLSTPNVSRRSLMGF